MQINSLRQSLNTPADNESESGGELWNLKVCPRDCITKTSSLLVSSSLQEKKYTIKKSETEKKGVHISFVFPAPYPNSVKSACCRVGTNLKVLFIIEIIHQMQSVGVLYFRYEQIMDKFIQTK